MKMPYRDKNKISSEYRAVLMGRTVGLVMLAVSLIAAAFPGLNTTIFSCICTLIIIPALLYQICADRTLIHTGQFLMEHEDDLYIVVGTFRLGFGRSYHRREKSISAYRISCIQRVKNVRIYPFGIAIRAVVRTAVDTEGRIKQGAFDNPQELKGWLDKHGRQKTMLFRLERSLLPRDESALLRRLQNFQATIQNIQQEEVKLCKF
ncbi:hypothetical protein AALB53_03165 [Lachnospiraceae bacterium 47-T17]